MKSHNSAYFLESDKIKIFPCANRSPNYDPEAKLLTEYNFTRPSYIDKDSYVISKTDSGTSTSIIFVLNGYFIELLNLITADIDIIKNNYCHLNIVEQDVVSGEQTTKIGSIVNKDNNALDTKIGTNQDSYFTGLYFDGTSDKGFMLLADDLNGDNNIPVANKLLTDSTKIENTDGKPISDEFTTNILNTTTLTANTSIKSPTITIAGEAKVGTMTAGKITATNGQVTLTDSGTNATDYAIKAKKLTTTSGTIKLANSDTGGIALDTKNITVSSGETKVTGNLATSTLTVSGTSGSGAITASNNITTPKLIGNDKTTTTDNTSYGVDAGLNKITIDANTKLLDASKTTIAAANYYGTFKGTLRPEASMNTFLAGASNEGDDDEMASFRKIEAADLGAGADGNNQVLTKDASGTLKWAAPGITAGVNNGELTINGGTTKVASFTANQSSNVSLSIVADTNVTVTPDAANNKITISSTDTKNTAGATDNNTETLFLIGATEQTDNPQTYSKKSLYVKYVDGSNILYADQIKSPKIMLGDFNWGATQLVEIADTETSVSFLTSPAEYTFSLTNNLEDPDDLTRNETTLMAGTFKSNTIDTGTVKIKNAEADFITLIDPNGCETHLVATDAYKFNLTENLNSPNEISSNSLLQAGTFKSKSMSTNMLTATGQIQAATFYATSDIRKKENIIDYNSSNSILDLQVKKFDFINGAKNQLGCIAQDLQKICPELVNEDSDGYLSIEESKIVYLLINEVKELKERIKKLEEK